MKKVVLTLNSLWCDSVRRHGGRGVVWVPRGPQRFLPVTYREMEAMVLRLGRGLIELGLGEGEAVPVLAEAGPGRLAGRLAVLGNRACVVSGTEVYEPEGLHELLAASGARIVLVGDREMLRRVRQVRDRLPRLETVVVLEEGFHEAGPSDGVRPLEVVLALGDGTSRGTAERFRRRREETRPADPAAVLYTPEAPCPADGVVLSHTALIPRRAEIGASDRLLSLLPAGHFLEWREELSALQAGASILCAGVQPGVHPTRVVGLPHSYRSFQRAALERVRRSGRAALFERLYRRSLEVIRARRPALRDRFGHRLAGLMFYRSIRRQLGGRARSAVCAGDALPEDLDEFYRVIGVPLRPDRDGRVRRDIGGPGRQTPESGISGQGPVAGCPEPERIEGWLEGSAYIDRAMVLGRGREGLRVLIVPDRGRLEEECRLLGIDCREERIPGLSGHPLLRELYLEILNDRMCEERFFRENDLLEDIVFTRPFSREDGTLTGTLKLRRSRILLRDSALIGGGPRARPVSPPLPQPSSPSSGSSGTISLRCCSMVGSSAVSGARNSVP